MKIFKFAMPVLAFLFAIAASFASGSNKGKELIPPHYIQEVGQCSQVQCNCDNSGTAICQLLVLGTTYYAVYDQSIGGGTFCVTLLRHSQNNGICDW